MKLPYRTLTLMLASAVPLTAQSSPADDSARAAAIVARHVAAAGGEAAFRAITHVHQITTMSIAFSDGPRTRTRMYMKAPNLVYMETNMTGVGLMKMGFDGTTHWSMSPIAGPAIHEDIPKALTDAANFLAPPLDGLRIWYAGRRTIGKRTFEAVGAVMPDSSMMIHYFDVETGLLAGMDPDDGRPPPKDRMSLSFSDYRRFGGILQPALAKTMVQGNEMVVRTITMSYKPFDAKIFDPPPEVRKLIRDKQGQR
jgi:hypothetical protein